MIHKMKIGIVRATQVDAPKIAGYLKKMLSYTENLGSHKINRSTKKWKEFIQCIKKTIESDPKRAFFLAKVESRIVGFSEGSIQELPLILEPKVLLHISAVYVENKFRNNGIGERLVNQLIQWGRKNSASEVNLNVLINNPAISLYKRIGFHVSRQEMYKPIKM